MGKVLHVKSLAQSVILFFFVCLPLHADTVQLEDGQELKGLVVEKHEDRIILNTEKGETPILRNTIKNILYDDVAQNLLQSGEEYETTEHWGKAVAYYEKALQANPNFDEARQAITRVRNRFSSSASAGRKNEMEQRQALYDSWGTGRSPAVFLKRQTQSQTALLHESLGIELETQGDWVQLSQVFSKKDASAVGLRKNDRLVAIDGKSIRYLSQTVVEEKLLAPRYTSFTLEFERDCTLTKTGSEKSFAKFGFDLKQEYQGAVVFGVKKMSSAFNAGLKEKDLLVAVDGNPIRYRPFAKIPGMIASAKNDTVILSVRRLVMLMRR